MPFVMRLIASGVLVSILVFVELALDGRRGQHEVLDTGPVSILVFVELALDGKGPRRFGLRGHRFNPCFRGTCS